MSSLLTVPSRSDFHFDHASRLSLCTIPRGSAHWDLILDQIRA